MDTIQHFIKTKQKMNDILKQVHELSIEVGVSDFADHIIETMDVLQREQFEVMVVGEFSNGKSTFINALLKDEVLPASSIPTTAILNKISYAQKEQFEVVYSNGKKEPLTRTDFAEFVAYPAEKSKERMTSKIVQKMKDQFGKPTHIEIGYPTEICRNNIVLIDSPGTNDMDEERVKITDSYIPKSDAAIFLLNAAKIFSASEKSFLQRILDADIHKIFFVINFKDILKTEEQFENVRNVVLENMPEGLTQPKIHFVSAKDALMHFTQQNVDLSTLNIRQRRRLEQQLPYEDTGIVQFEHHLMEFLTYERGLEKLRKPYLAATRLLKQLDQEFIQYEMQTLSNSIQNVEQHVHSIESNLKSVERSLKSRISSIQKRAEEKKQAIERWYKNALNDIASVANATLEEGIRAKQYPESIKDDISLATASKEKHIQQELNQRVKEMIIELFQSEGQSIQSELSRVSQSLLPNDIQYGSWGETIVRKEEKNSTVQEVSVGTAVVGGLAVLFSGGLFGWGLIGAGVAGAAVATYVNRESDESMYGRLRSQVKNRYSNSVSVNVKKLSGGLSHIVDHAVELFEKEVKTKIKQEKQRAQMLIQNQNLKQDDLERKMTLLETQSMKCRLLTEDAHNLMNSFKLNTEGVSELVHAHND